MQQQLMAVGSTVALIITFWFVFSLATKESESLLFSGLDPAAAGEIATELDSNGVSYSIRGSAIYVPDTQRDRLRIDLAQKGLPAPTGGGYELLDNLNGFSTTSDMFNAAYWRAKEGELTRTILAVPGVKTARVHLGIARNSAFRRANDQKTASVTIDAPMGLSDEQAKSIQYLTALAVAGLQPDHVAVVDTARGVIAGPGGPRHGMASLDTADRETKLEQSILRLLEAHVGVGNARVSVSMDIDRQSTAQTERLIDPNTRQIASRKLREEQERLDQNETGGALTVASNLPDGDAEKPQADDPRSLRTKREEDVTYTGTEIERKTETLAGSIRRLSVAVMLNEKTAVAEDGTVSSLPRPAEELDQLQSLVASAAGIDTARGDTLTVSVMPFEPIPEPEIVEPGFVDQFVLPRAMELGQLAFLGLLSLILGLFVVKPLLSPKKPKAIAGAEDGGPAIPQDTAELLTMLAEESPEDAAAILDSWLEEDEKAA